MVDCGEGGTRHGELRFPTGGAEADRNKAVVDDRIRHPFPLMTWNMNIYLKTERRNRGNADRRAAATTFPATSPSFSLDPAPPL
jgi:hypothetical protein